MIVFKYTYVQAVKYTNQVVIDKWVEYLKFHPGDGIIDKYGQDGKMNAVHIAVIRNDVQTLKKLADAGAGMQSHAMCTAILIVGPCMY